MKKKKEKKKRSSLQFATICGRKFVGSFSPGWLLFSVKLSVGGRLNLDGGTLNLDGRRVPLSPPYNLSTGHTFSYGDIFLSQCILKHFSPARISIFVSFKKVKLIKYLQVVYTILLHTTTLLANTLLQITLRQWKRIVSFSGSSPRHCARQHSFFRRNVAAVATTENTVPYLTGSRLEPQISSSSNIRVNTVPTGC